MEQYVLLTLTGLYTWANRESTSIRMLISWVKDAFMGKCAKVSGEPKWFHSARVAVEASKHEYLAFVVGILHDVLEDTSKTHSDIVRLLKNLLFTESERRQIMLSLILLTEDKTLSYMVRKAHKLKRLECFGSDIAKAVAAADQLDNLRRMVVEKSQMDTSIFWSKFNSSKTDVLVVHAATARAFGNAEARKHVETLREEV